MASYAAALELLAATIAANPVDPKRIYITGNSMGAYTVWYTIARWPGVFAAAVPSAGAGDPLAAKALLGTPIKAIHGDADDTVPYRGSLDMIEAIRRAGGRLAELITVDGGTHKAATPAYASDRDGNGVSDIVDWVMRQANPDPRSMIEARNLGF